MQINRRKNLIEVRKRARHHAKPLSPLLEIANDIFGNGAIFTPLKTRLRVRTDAGVTYIIRGWQEPGEGYVGIEIKQYGSDKVFRLKLA